MIVDLMADYPVLANLSAGGIDEAIEAGGLGRALMRARIRKATSPRKPGRPATAKVTRKAILRRGDKALRPIHPTSTNIQLSEMAKIWRDTFECTGAEAVRQTFSALGIEQNPKDVRTVAKLLSELSGRKLDRTVARNVPMPCPDSSLFGQLMRVTLSR